MLDITAIAAAAASRSTDLLHEWLPGGQVRGGQYRIGGLDGAPGGSLAIDVDRGSWFDHATGQKGGDLVALRAAQLGVSQIEAARDIARSLGLEDGAPMPPPPPRRPAKPEPRIGRPPADAGLPPGRPDHVFEFRDVDGALAFVIQRFDARGEQKKRFAQWSWDLDAGAWVAKAYPAPRPFFGGEQLSDRPDAPVVITEGELKCLAARRLMGHVYIGLAWTGGANAVAATDWTALSGRRVLIWPDADEAGETAARQLADILLPICSEVKVLDVSGMPHKWDAADCAMTWDEFKAWAKPRAQLYQPQPAEPDPVLEPERTIVAADDGDDDEDAPPPPLGFTSWDALGLRLNSKGTPFACLYNVCLVLEKWEPLRGSFWFDRFHGRIMRREGTEVRAWVDRDTLSLTRTIQDCLCMSNWGDELIWKGVQHVAARMARDEVADWVRSLAWDGIERIATFLPRAMGCEDSAYARAASANFWVSLVARATRPGCKVDTMVVFEGNQGARKSSALAAIAGERWHTEAQESVTSKDFFMCLSGKLLVEIAELDSFGKAEATKVKQVITNRVDTYRAPYARVAEDFPRRCIFAGTTNEDHYLRDSTGGRRFWPIKVGTINLELIRSEREQCFAEAFAKLEAGATWWEMPAETAAEQEARRQGDTWEEHLAEWIERTGVQAMSSADAFSALEIDPAKQTKTDQVRLQHALRALGWAADKKPVWRGGRAVRLWRRRA